MRKLLSQEYERCWKAIVRPPRRLYKKEDLGPALNQMELYFAELEDYEKCLKILEYKELLKRGVL